MGFSTSLLKFNAFRLSLLHLNAFAKTKRMMGQDVYFPSTSLRRDLNNKMIRVLKTVTTQIGSKVIFL